ncbi:cytochrome b, partial [Lentzea sp. NPDC092896]
HPIPLAYQGASVPKKMNKLGSAGHPVAGSTWSPDPVEETVALENAKHTNLLDTGSEDKAGELAGKPSDPKA